MQIEIENREEISFIWNQLLPLINIFIIILDFSPNTTPTKLDAEHFNQFDGKFTYEQ